MGENIGTERHPDDALRAQCRYAAPSKLQQRQLGKEMGSAFSAQRVGPLTAHPGKSPDDGHPTLDWVMEDGGAHTGVEYMQQMVHCWIHVSPPMGPAPDIHPLGYHIRVGRGAHWTCGNLITYRFGHITELPKRRAGWRAGIRGQGGWARGCCIYE